MSAPSLNQAVPLDQLIEGYRRFRARDWVDHREHYQSLNERQQPGTCVISCCDSRVDPMHARKMAARLQAASSSGRPVLLRVETRAGHGQGKPISKVLDEWTDVWSFVFAELGLEPPASIGQP